MLETPFFIPHKRNKTPTVLPPAKIQTNNQHKDTYSTPTAYSTSHYSHCSAVRLSRLWT